ncbi:MAG: hypothetical protein JSR61_15000 [Proteobacteria bacterium]|nr:hypothetical protein [Pseudomonadota bacterium]
MILVAGGQLDFNIGALLRRLLQRRVKFFDVLVGPRQPPRITIDMRRDCLRLNGKDIRPSACFMRHDVFLAQSAPGPLAFGAALNWFAAIKGWELAHDDVRGFNKSSSATESNKLRNLYLAARCGLAIPQTFKSARRALRGPLIQKPASGGEYTEDFDKFVGSLDRLDPIGHYPRFVQPRLDRPEMRVYRVGSAMLAFSLNSPDLDYRTRQNVRLRPVVVPRALGDPLMDLCDRVGLDFAAADFMRAPRGKELRFLEVNSQPMFAAFDQVCGGKLCDAIIDHLSPR